MSNQIKTVNNIEHIPIPTSVLYDTSLSWEAKGLYCSLYAIVSSVVDRELGNIEESKAFKELINTGYILKDPHMDSYMIYDQKQNNHE